jgi:hypothetical protein
VEPVAGVGSVIGKSDLARANGRHGSRVLVSERIHSGRLLVEVKRPIHVLGGATAGPVPGIVPVKSVIVVKVETGGGRRLGIFVRLPPKGHGQVRSLLVGVSKDGLSRSGMNARQNSIRSTRCRQSGKCVVASQG